MINSFEVSLVLVTIWGIIYCLYGRQQYSSKPYFGLLFLMGIAGLVLPIDKYIHYITNQYNALIIVLFAVLLVFTLIPWFYFDKKIMGWGTICLKVNYISHLKLIFIINILLGVYAVSYAFPYAKMALAMGADEVRHFILEDSFYPNNIFTTICVGIGFLTPIQIFLFYISLLNKSLWRYSLLLFLTSLSYIVISLPYMARDGFIFIPLTYFFLYKIFSKSIDVELKKKIKSYALILGTGILGLLLLMTFQRFFENAKYGLSETDSLIFGTWGYFFQQPYVFEQTVSHSTNFEGFSRRFELLESILGLPKTMYDVNSLNTSFGTMYTDFYTSYGWKTLIFFSLFYVLSFRLLLMALFKKKNQFAILLVFTIYLYYTISGLFYYKMFLKSVTQLYLLILCGTLFMVNFLYLKKNSKY